MYTSFSSNGDKNICVIMIHDQETFSCFPSPTDERRPRRVVVLIMYLDCYWLQDNYESLARCLQSSLVWADGLRQQYTLYPIELKTKVHTKVHNRGEGPYKDLILGILVGASSQASTRALSVIIKTDGSFAALIQTQINVG